MKQLNSSPVLALEVFDWKRKNTAFSIPMTSAEYAKGIRVASRVRNVELAVELFKESAEKGVKSTSIYNALMAAFMYNGLAARCESVFKRLKADSICKPTIVTYNILISVYGRLMMVDKMEELVKEVHKMEIQPNIYTYNNLIGGYITAWMWDRMESTYDEMQANGFTPDLSTHLLMLRGYAHSKKLEKMENLYDLVKDQVGTQDYTLIRTMICAYCRSEDSERVDKIEALLKVIPENEYRPWLNVLVIKVYADEDLIDGLERKINEAFAHNTFIISTGIMRCIIASYYRMNSLSGLENFVNRAEHAGWVICRSLYHCKMVMYAMHNRLNDMERVIDEMGYLNFKPTKKTFWIMLKGYSLWGHRYKAEWVLGLMCKHGYGIADDIVLPL
jgi:pentatricopeptide repeat protein